MGRILPLPKPLFNVRAMVRGQQNSTKGDLPVYKLNTLHHEFSFPSNLHFWPGPLQILRMQAHQLGDDGPGRLSVSKCTDYNLLAGTHLWSLCVCATNASRDAPQENHAEQRSGNSASPSQDAFDTGRLHDVIERHKENNHCRSRTRALQPEVNRMRPIFSHETRK